MKQQLVSIIVPAFNRAELLKKCVTSIERQTYNNIDLVISDDGSIDSTSTICDEYAMLDSRIVVVHKKNGGAADARNIGICISSGAYIGFVDSDDYIDEDTVELALNCINKTNSDFCIFMCLRHEKARMPFVTKTAWFDDEYRVELNTTAIKKLFLNEVGCGIAGKIIRSDIVKQLPFPVGNTNEDFAVSYKWMWRANQIVFLPRPKYHYIENDNSVSRSAFSRKNFDKYYNSVDMLEFVHNNVPKILPEAKYWLWYQSFCLLKQMLLYNHFTDFPEEFKKIKHTIRQDSIGIIHSDLLTVKEKAAYLVAAWTPRLYRIKHLSEIKRGN